MKQCLNINEWLGLSVEMRNKLKEIFAINRSEGMSVRDGILVSDGCSQADLIAGITIGKMIEYLGNSSFVMNTNNSDELFDKLFIRVLNRLTPIEDIEVVDTVDNKPNLKEDDKKQPAEANTRAKSKGAGVKTNSKGNTRNIKK